MKRGFRRTVAGAAVVTFAAASAAQAHDGNVLGDTPLAAGSGDAHATVLGLRTFEPLSSLSVQAENVRYVTGDNGFTGGHVAVESDRLYLGSYGRGMKIYDIKDPARPEPIGEYIPGGPRADAPPDAAVFDGRHIAVLNGTRRTSTHSAVPGDARTDRTEFLDVTDAANPKLLWTFGPNQVDGESHNGDIVDERRLYLPSGGSAAGSSNGGVSQGLRIYDLNPLLGETPAAPENIFRGDPVEMWEASPHRDGRPVGAAFTHTHDITVYTDYPVEGRGERDIALLAEGGSYLGNGNTGSVFVIDITNPRAPEVLLRWVHESGPGHHPIRYNHEAQFLDGDPRLMLVADEDLHNGCGGAGGLVAVRLSDDLTSAVREESEWFIPAGTPAAMCSVHVFSSEGDRVFIGSYNAGLQVVSYEDPAKPRQVGHYIAPGATAWGAQVHRGYVYVGDMARGLDVLEVERAAPQRGKGKGKDKPRGKPSRG
jgi:hypothetical protein